MSINEIMKIGTDGMTEEQRQAEQERRLKVVERLNKIWSQRKAGYNRQIRKIKADESDWLKVVAWFMY